MIVLNVTYELKENVSPADFVNALEENGLAPYCRQEKGNICYSYFYPADGSSQVLLLEKWEDEESLTAHAQTENFARIGRIKNQYVLNTEIHKYSE